MAAITKQLTTTGPLAPMQFDRALHVEDLEDYEVTTMLDTYLFGHSAWCDGTCEYFEDRGHIISQCRVCGARDVSGRHVRLAPFYSIEQIATAMAARDERCVIRFALALYRYVHRGDMPRITAIAVMLRFIDVLRSPRVVACAALEALGVVDGRGYLTKGGRR